MRLRGQVIDLIGRNLFKDPAQPGSVGYVAVMEVKPGAALVRVHIDGVKTLRREGGSAAENAMDIVIPCQEKLR